MPNEMLPVGVRRDGSYYTRVLWADTNEGDVGFWANNLIDDDYDRNGGTWGANCDTAANAVLDFFGETQSIAKIAFYKNVGATISVLEELAKHVNVYVYNANEPLALRSKADPMDPAAWTKIAEMDTIMTVGWQEIPLDKPVNAKYIRIELVDNFCKRDDSFIPWIEMSEVKFYPEA